VGNLHFIFPELGDFKDITSSADLERSSRNTESRDSDTDDLHYANGNDRTHHIYDSDDDRGSEDFYDVDEDRQDGEDDENGLDDNEILNPANSNLSQADPRITVVGIQQSHSLGL
jgi:hypothetical protein